MKVLLAGVAAIVLSAVTQLGSGDSGSHTWSRILVLTLLILGGMRLAGWFSGRPAVGFAMPTPRPAPVGTRPMPAVPTPPAAASAQEMPPPTSPAPYPVRYSRRERRIARRDSERHLLSAKSSRDKFTELVGSLLLSAAVAGGRLAVDVDRAASRPTILVRVCLAGLVRRDGGLGRADSG